MIEKQYLDCIIEAAQINKLCGITMYNGFDSRRIELHDKICEKYGLDKTTCSRITDHLDDSIGLDLDREYTDPEIQILADRLARVLHKEEKK